MELYSQKICQFNIVKPTGFYIVRHEYGENQARLLFQQANDGNVDAQLSIAKCFMDVAEQPYALPWYEKAAIGGKRKSTS